MSSRHNPFCHVLCCCIVCISTITCSFHNKPDTRFAQLDRLAFEQPDSALRLLQAYDALPQTFFEGKPLSKAGRMHMELMRGVAVNMSQTKFTTDSMMLEVSRYYHHHGCSNEKMLSLYLLGYAYHDLNNIPRSLDSWLQAADAADISSSDCDRTTLMRVYAQMSELYGWMRLDDKEYMALNTAIRLSWQVGDTLSAINLEKKLCVQLLETHKFKEGITEITRLQQKVSGTRYNDYAGLFDCLLAKANVSLSNYFEAERLIDKYEHSSIFQTKPYLINGEKGLLYILKGECMLHTEDPDSAIYYYNKAYPDRHLWSNELMIYSGLYHAYSILQEPDSVVKYADLYSILKSKDYSNDAVQTSVAKHIYDYCMEQKKSRDIAIASARLKVVILLLIFSLILLSLVVILYRQKKHIQLLKLEQDYLTATSELNELKKQLETIIQSKASDATLLKEKRQMILYYQKRVSSLKKTLQSLRSPRKVPLENTEIVRHFKKFFCDRISIREEDWQRLARVVDDYYPLFRDQIYERAFLSENEYRICLLSLLNFSSSEMDLLMGKANSYSTHMRKKLIKKIFRTSGSAKEFNERIQLLTQK